MPLDPQFRTVLDTLAAQGLTPLVRDDVATTRAHYQQLALSRRGAEYVPEQVASVADQRSPGGVPVRVYEPSHPRVSTGSRTAEVQAGPGAGPGHVTCRGPAGGLYPSCRPG